MGEEISRRGFLGLLGKAFGAAAVASVIDLIPSTAEARKYLQIRFENHKGIPSLKIPIRRGVSYTLLSNLYTGNENNSDEIKKFNNNIQLVLGKTKYIWIQWALLKPVLREIFSKNKFVTFEIENDGDDGIGTLWEIAKDYMNNNVEIAERLNTLLILNDEINPITGVVYDEQIILVPLLWVKTDLIDKEKPKKAEPKKQKVTKKRNRQNPLRVDINDIRGNLRTRDMYMARRIRSLGGGKYRISKHTGIDLVAPIGTRLYAVERAQVIIAGREPNRRLWRNGNVVSYRTLSGFEVKYCHLNRVLVRRGENVDLDTVLGTVGISGNADRSNPHVHIGVKRNGVVIDPYNLIVVDT